MRRANRGRLLAGVILLGGSLSTRVADGLQTRGVTIPFPRGGSEPVSLTNGSLLIRSVTLRGRPSRGELRRARRDPDDTKLLRFIFRVANAGRRDWRARIHIQVLGPEGRVLAANDREGEVDAHDFHDRITVFARIHTIDYPRARSVRIEADFSPD